MIEFVTEYFIPAFIGVFVATFITQLVVNHIVIMPLRHERDELQKDLMGARSGSDVWYESYQEVIREKGELQKQIDRMWESQQKGIKNICKLEELLKRAKSQRNVLREKLSVFKEAAKRGNIG